MTMLRCCSCRKGMGTSKSIVLTTFLAAIVLCFLSLSVVLYESNGSREDVAMAMSLSKPVSTAAVGDGGVVGGGCLLLKDDNDRLPEWLAYHYVRLPLRSLVVAVDPLSATSPKDILDRWSDRIDVTLWDGDEHFVGEWTERGTFAPRHPLYSPHVRKDTVKMHRERQLFFVRNCLIFHKLFHPTVEYVPAIDTDEFLLLNRIPRNDTTPLTNNTSNTKAKERLQVRRRIPSNSSVTVVDFLQREKDNHGWTTPACLGLPRVLFSAIENHDNDRDNNQTLSSREEEGVFHFKRYSTLRYRHHADPHQVLPHNGAHKSLITMSRVSLSTLIHTKTNVHRPLAECQPSTSHPFSHSPLKVNHYLGSWEQYSSRRDKRRTFAKFQEKALLDDGTAPSSELRDWLTEFIRSVGDEQSRFLLRDAGLVTILPPSS